MVRWPTTLVGCWALQPLRAQTDEIQVYTGDVETPGKFNLTFHANYTRTAHCRRVPRRSRAAGLAQRRLRWAYGVTIGSRRAPTLGLHTHAYRILSSMGSSFGAVCSAARRGPKFLSMA